MAYEVKLDVFQGPIDLLLNLITRQRVDIYDVSLAGITDEYLAAVARLPVDLEGTTGFLLVAATLLELKSARLLPTRSAEGDERLLEERDLLLGRLVECATFRAAGDWVAVRLDEGAAFHGRSVTLEERFMNVLPDVLARTSAADLGRAAAALLAPRPAPELDVSHVAPIRASVRDAIVEVARRLRSSGEAGFAALCPPGGDRIEVVVRFLALLELYKVGAVDLVQGARFGDIVASWTGEADEALALAEAEEYTLARAEPR